MSGLIHFVDITGALQTLGPGARIQFNGQDGTRREIVLVDPDSLANLYAELHSELASVDQRLSDKVKSNRLFSMANEETLEALARVSELHRQDLDTVVLNVSMYDSWSISRTQSLYDWIYEIDGVLFAHTKKVRKIAIAGVSLGVLSLVISIISLF